MTRPTPKERPLSPHLSIYKPIPTMIMSIMHRLTGIALYGGSALLTLWLFAAAQGAECFEFVSALYGSLPGKIALFGFTWALIHHLLGGVKHLVQDTGAALDKDLTTKMALAQPILSILATGAIWSLCL